MNVRRILEQVTELGDSVVLRGVQVHGKEYDLHITNHAERLTFQFSKPKLDTAEFTIRIIDGQLHFDRTLWRPDHDHDDSESLQIVNGEPRWFSRFPYQGEGRSFFAIPFGSVVE